MRERLADWKDVAQTAVITGTLAAMVWAGIVAALGMVFVPQSQYNALSGKVDNLWCKSVAVQYEGDPTICDQLYPTDDFDRLLRYLKGQSP